MPRSSDFADNGLKSAAGRESLNNPDFIMRASIRPIRLWLQLKMADCPRKIGEGSAAMKVIRTGPYRGYLLVQQHRYYERPEGGSYNPVFVIRPDGHKEFMVPGSGNDDGELAVEPWLAKRNWRAW